MKLKNLFKYTLALMLCVGFTACSDDDEIESPVPTDFKVAHDNITALKSGGEYSIIVQSTTQPTVTPDASWVTVKEIVNSGSKNQIWTALLNVEANETNYDRTANVAVVAQGTANVTVSQIAADGLYDSSKSDVPELTPTAGGSYTLVILANNDLTYTANNHWINIESADNTRTSVTERTFNVTVDKNPGDAREGSITFTAGDLTLDVPFKQAANENMLTGKTATEIAKSVVAGWNIGNSLEAYSDKAASETGFGNPLITRTLIEGIKAAGINAVRLPCAWDGYIEDESTYKIKDSWLERVDEVVSWCLENDLYVIVNIHWDGGWLEENCTADKKDANVKEQKALWTQIATKLGVYDQHLLFAGCNEPNVSDADQMAVLKEYEQAFIDAVRATGGHNAERALIVQGPSTDIDKTDKLFGDMPTDKASNLLMAEVHYYDPWQFCGLEADASWGKAHYFWGDNVISGSDRNSTGTLQDIKNQFKKMKEMFVDKGIPVILGEYGAITNHDSEISDATQLAAHHQSRYDLNEAVTREAKNYGLVPFMWDTGEGINRKTGAISSDWIVPAIKAGANAGSYPY